MPMGGLTPPSYSICCAAATHQALLVGCDFFSAAKKNQNFTCQGRDRDAKGEKEGEKAKVGFGVGNPSTLREWWWEWWWGELFAVAVLIQIRMEPLQCSSIMRAPLFLSLETCSTLTAATLET